MLRFSTCAHLTALCGAFFLRASAHHHLINRGSSGVFSEGGLKCPSGNSPVASVKTTQRIDVGAMIDLARRSICSGHVMRGAKRHRLR